MVIVSDLNYNINTRWVPYDIAKPFLDRRKYVVLSDYAALPNGESSPLNDPAIHMEEQENEFVTESSNDIPVNEDEMAGLDSDSSDDESDSEANGPTTVSLADASLNNVFIGVRGTRLRYKVWQVLHTSTFVSHSPTSFVLILQIKTYAIMLKKILVLGPDYSYKRAPTL